MLIVYNINIRGYIFIPTDWWNFPSIIGFNFPKIFGLETALYKHNFVQRWCIFITHIHMHTHTHTQLYIQREHSMCTCQYTACAREMPTWERYQKFDSSGHWPLGPITTIFPTSFSQFHYIPQITNLTGEKT